MPVSVGSGKRVEGLKRVEQGIRAFPQFAHSSELEFVRFLDFYQIEWRYEPACFPLERDEQGRVTESFTPDFLLPLFDLYIELTTMKQRLVTRKNRKIRRMWQLYPELNVKILYGRDYRRHLFKLGLPQ